VSRKEWRELDKRKIYKTKQRKLKCINTHQAAQTHKKAKMPPVDLAQASSISLERDSARKVGHFYFLLAKQTH